MRTTIAHEPLLSMIPFSLEQSSKNFFSALIKPFFKASLGLDGNDYSLITN
jgi:hypothetical protein